MDLRIIAVGRLRAGPEHDLVARYAARLRPALTIVEIAEATGAPAERRRREGAALLAALPQRAFVVALDEAGLAFSSAAFADKLRTWTEPSRPVAFLIGGAEGLDAPVLERADVRLSLGPLTLPHMLARVVLAEQLYRAQSILAGHPYHRARRAP